MSYFTVVDDAHTSAGAKLQAICNEINDDISEYISILNQVTSEAAKAGHTTERYNEYKSIINGLQGQFTTIGNILNAKATGYISDIDTADSYLYQ